MVFLQKVPLQLRHELLPFFEAQFCHVNIHTINLSFKLRIMFLYVLSRSPSRVIVLFLLGKKSVLIPTNCNWAGSLLLKMSKVCLGFIPDRGEREGRTAVAWLLHRARLKIEMRKVKIKNMVLLLEFLL